MDSRALREARRRERDELAAARAATGRNTAGLARWRRFRRRVGSVLLALFAPLALRVLACTWRVRRVGDAGFALLRSDAPWVLAMWHGRMLALLPLRWHRARGFHVLVSPSDDGGLATQALQHFGCRIVRGSLSRAGARALRELHERVAAGGQLVITPDGPRGPQHAMNVGIAWLARRNGVPILPLGVAVDRAWRLRSWDRFVIPKPFARLCVCYGEPVPVPADATDEDLERVAARVRAALLANERAAFDRLGVADDLEGS